MTPDSKPLSWLTTVIRNAFIGHMRAADRRDGLPEGDGYGADFDTWLAAHDAELREQIAAEVRDALDTHTMTLTESTARAVSRGYRTARAIALDTIHNPKEKP